MYGCWLDYVKDYVTLRINVSKYRNNKIQQKNKKRNFTTQEKKKK